MHGLAIIYQKQDRYEEAEQLYLECLLKRKSAFGKNHPGTRLLKKDLDSLYLERDMIIILRCGF
jgi:hypothetical protein